MRRRRLDDRFELVERVPGGGMGEVWRARARDGRDVAIKLLADAESADDARFWREIDTLARLAHPAIVAHVAHGIADDGAPYLAMEWIDGVTVAERLLGDGLSVAEAVAVARRVAAGLGAAHRAGVVHRDVKPSNVMLRGGAADAAVVIDFGVARTDNARYALTRTGVAVGTPGYMAPEQALGERALTPAADVFALGCVLYECATGRPAFSGAAPAAVLAKILAARPVGLHALDPAPRDLALLVDRMLARDPAARPADGDEVVAALDALGAAPDGPRRSAHALVAAPTLRIAGVAHAVVMASADPLGDAGATPTPEQSAAVWRAAVAASGAVDVLRTGTVVVRLRGAPADLPLRAARAALAVQDALAGWTVAISPVTADVGDAIDGAAVLLKTAAAAALGDDAPRAAVHPQTATALVGELAIEPGDPPRMRAGPVADRVLG